MAAGYNSLTVTRTGSGVSWSFNATAQSDTYYWCKVECNGDSDIAEGQNVPASVQVTGSLSFSDPDYKTGSKTYTVKQYVRASYDYEWAEDGSVTVTVTWDTAVLRVVINGNVTLCSNIKVKSGSTVKDVIGVYSVQNGTVKPGV